MSKDFKVEDLYVIKGLDKKCKEKSQKVIKVCSFNGAAPKLICQQYYKDSDGKWQPGKLGGFDYDDMLWIKNKVDRQDVLNALKPSDDDEDE